MSSKAPKNTLQNKRILCFGGAGSIGSELVRQLSKENKVYVVDINESGVFDVIDEIGKDTVWGRVGDIRDYKTVVDIFQDFKPQIVFNAAAYKHVPLMQYTPLEAIQTNVLGHQNILHAAKTWECVEKLVFISTDKSVSSESVMGGTKRLGEVLTINQGYTVVRFGNVMGSRGSLTTIWQRQLDRGDPITVTDPSMERYMMTIPEAVELILEAATYSKGGEIYVMDMGKKHNILKLAEEIVKTTGGEIKITGIRQGETLTENIMSLDEERRSIKSGKFYIIK